MPILALAHGPCCSLSVLVVLVYISTSGSSLSRDIQLMVISCRHLCYHAHELHYSIIESSHFALAYWSVTSHVFNHWSTLQGLTLHCKSQESIMATVGHAPSCHASVLLLQRYHAMSKPFFGAAMNHGITPITPHLNAQGIVPLC